MAVPLPSAVQAGPEAHPDTQDRCVLNILKEIRDSQRTLFERQQAMQSDLSELLASWQHFHDFDIIEESGSPMAKSGRRLGDSEIMRPSTIDDADLTEARTEVNREKELRLSRLSTFSTGLARIVHGLGYRINPIKPVLGDSLLARCVNGRWLDTFANIMVVVHCTVIGVSINQSIQHEPQPWLKFLQHLCVVLYIVEVIIRLAARGVKKQLHRPWFYFDLGLIATGVVHLWVLDPVVQALGDSEGDGLRVAKRLLGCVMVLRTLRFARIARSYNLMVWKLLHAIKSSAATVVSAAMLLALALYLFGCIAVELFTKSSRFADDPNTKPVVDQFFPCLPVAMMSLLRLVTLDGASEIYEPLVVQEPWTLFFFLLVFLSLAVSLLNIITADLVDNSMRLSGRATASTDKRLKRSKYSHVARDLLRRIAPPHSDLITEAEIDRHWRTISQRCSLNDDVISPQEFCEYFVEFDGERKVDQQAFEKAILALTLSESPLLTKITRIMETLDKKLDRIGSTSSLGAVGSEVNGVRVPSNVRSEERSTAGGGAVPGRSYTGGRASRRSTLQRPTVVVASEVPHTNSYPLESNGSSSLSLAATHLGGMVGRESLSL